MIDFIIGLSISSLTGWVVCQSMVTMIENFEEQIKYQEQDIEFWEQYFIQMQQELYG